MKKTVLLEFSDLNERGGIGANDSKSVKNIVAIICGLPMELNEQASSVAYSDGIPVPKYNYRANHAFASLEMVQRFCERTRPLQTARKLVFQQFVVFMKNHDNHG